MKALLLIIGSLLTSYTIAQPYKGGPGDGHASATITNVFISSVTRQDLQLMKCYPSLIKSDQKMKIELLHGPVSLKISDLQGKKLMEYDLNNSTEIELFGLNPGMYFIHVENRSGRSTHKFMVIE